MKTILILIAVLALSACQHSKTNRIDFTDFIAQQGLLKQDRVQNFRFQGWQPLNDRYLILRSNQRKNFLIKLMSSCFDLPFANSIQVQRSSNTTLVARFDSIVVLGQLNQECSIDSIYQMDKIQKQALLDFSNQTEEMRG